jgi:hypothetical protein
MFENAGLFGGISAIDVPKEVTEKRKQNKQTAPVR